MSRQKLTLKGERKALDDDTLLQDAGVSDGSELFVKDLGAQISWRTVFVVEYVSSKHVLRHHPEISMDIDWASHPTPSLLLVPANLLWPTRRTQRSAEVRKVNHPVCPYLTIHERLAYALVMLHFLKRELETLL